MFDDLTKANRDLLVFLSTSPCLHYCYIVMGKQLATKEGSVIATLNPKYSVIFLKISVKNRVFSPKLFTHHTHLIVSLCKIIVDIDKFYCMGQDILIQARKMITRFKHLRFSDKKLCDICTLVTIAKISIMQSSPCSITARSSSSKRYHKQILRVFESLITKLNSCFHHGVMLLVKTRKMHYSEVQEVRE